MTESFNPGDAVWDTGWQPPKGGWIEDIDDDGHVWLVNNPPDVDPGDSGLGWLAQLADLRVRILQGDQ